ncbi:hypothetical protein BEWA_023670 [Theileria equi strain WA]|uniref:Uncharacterized protein n=1 Tax=Theileria equi strain WA TaxID=1537102 RepID=L0AWA5_THEEQ|nr:hypothetical protein BEWA_023670 [Theileria equi strain WA]AFZ79518.1 hypothetical protein BEWA_023670 [Theileria equi strain WA]|eukprot:XP_004829184.1 hypothetical protein BEWA_023670 [Theileria equi strain WA]
MTQQEVTIELKEKPTTDGRETTYTGASTGNKTIIVERTTDPPGSNFYRYTHKVSNGEQQFTLARVLGDDSQKLEGIPPHSGSDGKVTSVSAYYWKRDNGTQTPNKVLLIEVVYSGPDKTKYYKNTSGTEWVETSLQNDLEKVLDQQNCYSNNAVTLDLTRNNSEGHKHGKGYCCDEHRGDQYKVSVQEIPVNHRHNHGKSTRLYKHSITNGGRFAGIKYYENGDTNNPKNRNNVKIPGLQNPGKDSVDIYALYSGNNQEPELIYVNSAGGSGVTGWFKKGSGTNGDWEKADKLQNITPDNFRDLECNEWNGVVGELDGYSVSSLQECQEYIKQQELRAQETVNLEQQQRTKESEEQGQELGQGLQDEEAERRKTKQEGEPAFKLPADKEESSNDARGRDDKDGPPGKQAGRESDSGPRFAGYKELQEITKGHTDNSQLRQQQDLDSSSGQHHQPPVVQSATNDDNDITAGLPLLLLKLNLALLALTLLKLLLKILLLLEKLLNLLVPV